MAHFMGMCDKCLHHEGMFPLGIGWCGKYHKPIDKVRFRKGECVEMSKLDFSGSDHVLINDGGNEKMKYNLYHWSYNKAKQTLTINVPKVKYKIDAEALMARLDLPIREG